MAPDAICLQYLCSMRGERDVLRDHAGIEEQNVFHPVNRLPDIMHRCIVIRQMAVYALFSPVRTFMRPRFVLGLHHVALGTEIGGFGPGQKLRGTVEKEKNHGDPGENKNHNDFPRRPCLPSVNVLYP
jgi:hypothetical protein